MLIWWLVWIVAGRAGEPIGRYGPGDYFDDPDSCNGDCRDGECCDCGPGPILPEVGCTAGCAGWSAGIEFTLLKPHFESNPAITLLQSDGDTFEEFSDTEFDYNTQLAPRIWLEIFQCGSLGMRIGYWQFDHGPASVTASPPDNGFGRISPPVFGDVDLSTTIPGSVLAAASDLNAYNIDLEGTKSFDCGMWGWMATAGIRYAEISQSYNAQLTNVDGQTQGTIDYSHRIEGVGPTASLRTQRPFTPRLSLFGFGRGALLFGDSNSVLAAVEDQDLDNQLNTNRVTSRNDLLPLGEMQVGLQFTPPAAGPYFPYFHVALEGQLWGGAGNASGEVGNMGFFGLNVALGVDW